MSARRPFKQCHRHRYSVDLQPSVRDQRARIPAARKEDLTLELGDLPKRLFNAFHWPLHPARRRKSSSKVKQSYTGRHPKVSFRALPPLSLKP
jgi:hypothetical protein